MSEFIHITPENIDNEHICCAFSDKKCADSYAKKKDWLKQEFQKDYVFYRLDERAKVFIEYGPAETSWSPVEAPNYLVINCFWVSGKYKSNGNGSALLQKAMDDALAQNKDGLVTIVGTKKLHFMSDTKWLLKQGFEVCESLDYGFSLLVKKVKSESPDPKFKKQVISGTCPDNKGLVVYYTNRCPFSEFHVENSMRETAKKRELPLKIIKLESMEEAQSTVTPATIFSLYLDGKFLTNDISVCMDTRFDKIMSKLSKKT